MIEIVCCLVPHWWWIYYKHLVIFSDLLRWTPCEGLCRWFGWKCHGLLSKCVYQLYHQGCHESYFLLAEVPFALARYWGGWNLQSHEIYPSPPITVGMSPPAAKPTASTSSASASLCFHAKVPAKLAFVPYRWAWSCLFMHCVYMCLL